MRGSPAASSSRIARVRSRERPSANSSSIAGPRRLRAPARAGVGAYLAAVVASAASTEADARDRVMLLAVLPTMHLGWGFGTLAGMARFGPPLAALAHMAGIGDAVSVGQAGEVYAPSLRDAGA